MTARIYKPYKTAMQSGANKQDRWILEFERIGNMFVEPIMGWVGSEDTLSNQVVLKFTTQEDAIEYAIRHNIKYEIEVQDSKKKSLKRTYIDNFKQ